MDDRIARQRLAVIEELLDSRDPCVRWKVRARALGEDPCSPAIKRLQEEVRTSPRVEALLARRDGRGRLTAGRHVYDKWQGAHWVLASLADIGYPAGDESLHAMRDQVVEFWLRDEYYREFEASRKAQAYRKPGVPVMAGRHRQCASQQGNTLLYLTTLGIADERAERLVERLLHWQWPDGGWNCDKNPAADTSSFMETLLPMRGLAAYGRAHGHEGATTAARRAAEVFLSRSLYRRRADGAVIHPDFLCLHYPLYWHYDILGGLEAMAELGLLADERCAPALDRLEEMELRGGGWPAGKRFYKVSSNIAPGADYVDWGGASKGKANDWVTLDALYVLREAGRTMSL